MNHKTLSKGKIWKVKGYKLIYEDENKMGERMFKIYIMTANLPELRKIHVLDSGG